MAAEPAGAAAAVVEGKGSGGCAAGGRRREEDPAEPGFAAVVAAPWREGGSTAEWGFWAAAKAEDVEELEVEDEDE